MAAHSVDSWVGGFFSNFTRVLQMLFIYVVLCVGTYILLIAELGPDKRAAFIAYQVATGGDPYNFSEALRPFPFTWGWILVLHVLSWLIVPVLAATAIDAAYRAHEEKKARAERALKLIIASLLKKHSHLRGEALKQAVSDATETLHKIKDDF